MVQKQITAMIYGFVNYNDHLHISLIAIRSARGPSAWRTRSSRVSVNLRTPTTTTTPTCVGCAVRCPETATPACESHQESRAVNHSLKQMK